MIEASCHCGAVRIEASAVPDELNECLCSICRRYGVRWAYYRRASVTLPAEDLTDRYLWGSRATAFHRCRTCGCVSHWTPADPGRDRIGVNARLLDPELVAGIPVFQSEGPPG